MEINLKMSLKLIRSKFSRLNFRFVGNDLSLHMFYTQTAASSTATDAVTIASHIAYNI